MQNQNHTPGPWKPLLQAFAVCTDNSAPKQANICLLDRKSQNMDEDIMRANARLIAAAPDLLAFAQSVARSACLDQYNGDHCVCFACQAQALVTKAISQ